MVKTIFFAFLGLWSFFQFFGALVCYLFGPLDSVNGLSSNLNNQWYLTNIKNNISENKNLYNCIIQNKDTSKIKQKKRLKIHYAV